MQPPSKKNELAAKPRIKKLWPSFLIFFLLVAISQNALAQLTIGLSPSNYNGYSISCFGGSNGSIDLTITGGVPPYSIVWSTNDTIEDLDNLPAGYYRVTVTDSDSLPVVMEEEITLTEPRQILINGTFYMYPNGFNISVHGACNGMVSFSATEGVEPYTWIWNDTATTPNRTQLCSGWYSVTAMDVNGCKGTKEGFLKEPPRGDWLLTGNQATDPELNFLGTTDSTDFSLRTNNSERLRVTGDGRIEFFGDLRIDSASTDTIRMIFVDQEGFLRTYGPGTPSPIAPVPDWNVKGNDFINDQIHFVGTLNPADLVFKTTDSFLGLNEAMRINQVGGVGIGTQTIPAGYKLVVDNGKVGFREAFVKLSGTWPDYVFDEDYKLTPIDELRNQLSSNKHLPGMPTAKDIEYTGQNLGEIQRLQQEKIEELYLYIIKLNERISHLENENDLLKGE